MGRREGAHRPGHVRQIHNGLFGWYGTDAAELFPHPPQVEAERIVAGFGGPATVLEQARPALKAGRKFTDALRVPLRALFSSPAFLFHGGEPGKLDDFSLATRLSYFLWKSLPDEKLFELAKGGELSDPKVLAAQVDRMLGDEKSMRFVEDFLGQWLRLREINATTPDEKL